MDQGRTHYGTPLHHLTIASERPLKRPRPSDEPATQTLGTSSTPSSLSRAISPPRKRRQDVQFIKSPFQLTAIKDLPPSENVDAITLKDLLGDPLIKECWNFNYLHDINFIVDAFDEDTRDMVKVHVVHGFWMKDDLKRVAIEVRYA
jgi:hypothetical protein